MSNNKDLGIVALTMSNDKSTKELIDLAKSYYDNNPYSQVCFFNSFCDVIDHNNVPILQLSHAKFFYGNLLVTDIKMLELCYSFPNIQKIVFFASSIPWTEHHKNYKEWEKLFYDNRLEIISLNKQIYDIFDICYKAPKCIAERLSYEKIEQCL